MRILTLCLAITGFFSHSHGVLAAQQAGVAAGIVGKSHVSGGDRPDIIAISSGMKMLLNDRVQSGETSRMQILLLDETVFTVGPNSDLVIDKFVFDPATQTGK